MTGRELIQLITSNNAEDLPIMVWLESLGYRELDPEVITLPSGVIVRL